MKRLLKYLKEYRVKAVLAPIFKMLEACFELMVPLVIARLIDKGIKPGDKDTIIFCGLILVGLTIVGYAASLTAQYFAARAAIGFGKSLRNDLFKVINGLSYSDIDRLSSSTLITRMTSDVNLVVTGVNMFLRLFLRSPFIVLGAVIMAFTVDTSVSIVFLVVMPVLTLVVCFVTYASIPLYRKVQEKLDRVTLLTREGLVGIRVIRAFSREEIEKKEFAVGTYAIAKKLTKVKGTTIIGGGDSASAVINMGLAHKMTHISTGGGASLKLFEGKILPGVDVIDNI